MKRYLDKGNNLIKKSKASRCAVSEIVIDENKVWKTIWSEMKDI